MKRQMKLLPRSATPAERFERFYQPIPFSGCWIWIGPLVGIDGYGYGVIVVNKKRVRAHRFSWEMVHGPIPAKGWILHKCDVTACVNPDHLYVGTPLDNFLDTVSRKRGGIARGQILELKRARQIGDLCPKGHLVSGENVLVSVRGHINCRRCHYDWQNKRYQDKRQRLLSGDKKCAHTL